MALCAALTAALCVGAPRAASAQQLQVVRHTLPNGMVVLTHEDHSIPMITFHVFYRVGSRNERPGITGVSHLFEHMMFNGSAKFAPNEFDRLLENAGGNNNAYTTEDVTVYHETFPREALPLVLDLESDRMVSLRITPQNLEQERGIVKEERRVSVDNNPASRLYEELFAAAFVAHPYGWPVVGWMGDLDAIKLEEAKRFYDTFYGPNNATMVVAGDFSTPELLERLEAVFGKVPKRGEIEPVPNSEPEQEGERRVTLVKDAALPAVFIGFKVPAVTHADAPALKVLETILGEGDSSRLFQKLIYGRLAAEASADFEEHPDPTLFTFYAQAQEVSTQFLARDVDRQLDVLSDVALRPAFAADEVDRVKQQRLAEIAALPEDPRSFASVQFETALFEGSAYGHPAAGLRQSVTSVTREDVAGFYRAHYTPSNAVLAVVGDFSTDAMVSKLSGAFGGWERREAARQPFGRAPQVTGRRIVVVDSPDATQTQIRIGNVGISRNDPDFYAVQVANTVFGGTFNARLMVAIRVERSLSYGAYSRHRARLHPGPFVIETFTKNETARETIDVALETLRKFRSEPIPAVELDKAKNFILGQFPLGIETADGLASIVTAIETFDLPRDYVETYAQKIRALSAADVSAVIQRRFPLDNLLIVVVTPQVKTKQQLEGLGPIDVKRSLEGE